MEADHLTQLIIAYRYWIIIPLTVIEGPIVAFSVGTLSSFGYFNPYIAIWIFFVKDLLVDGFFYFLGRYARKWRFAQRWLEREGVFAQGVQAMSKQWAEHGWRTMFVSKLPHGLSPAFLATAGMVHFSLKRFWLYAGSIALMQYGLLFVLGYFLGHIVGASSDIVRNIQYGLMAILLVGTVYYIGAWYLRQRFKRLQ